MKYVVHVREYYDAEIIVEAEDREAAEELADDLINEGVVDIVGQNPDGRYGRNVECIDEADKYLHQFHNFMPTEYVYSKEGLQQ